MTRRKFPPTFYGHPAAPGASDPQPPWLIEYNAAVARGAAGGRRKTHRVVYDPARAAKDVEKGLGPRCGVYVNGVAVEVERAANADPKSVNLRSDAKPKRRARQPNK